MANLNWKDWSHVLENALCAHRTTYWTSLGMSPYQIVFDKACHLPELEELRLEAYENSEIYKEKEFKVDQKVLLFNSQLKLIVVKLCSRWDGPFVVTNVFPYSVVEVRDTTNNNTFKVNGYHLKPYHEGPIPRSKEVPTPGEGTEGNCKKKVRKNKCTIVRPKLVKRKKKWVGKIKEKKG
ncbi:hypothetical protein CR513_02291, partial [Mucuna pruriens]